MFWFGFGVGGTNQSEIIPLEVFDKLLNFVFRYANTLEQHTPSYQCALNVSGAGVFYTLGNQLILVLERSHAHIDVKRGVEALQGNRQGLSQLHIPGSDIRSEGSTESGSLLCNRAVYVTEVNIATPLLTLPDTADT